MTHSSLTQCRDTTEASLSSLICGGIVQGHSGSSLTTRSAIGFESRRRTNWRKAPHGSHHRLPQSPGAGAGRHMRSVISLANKEMQVTLRTAHYTAMAQNRYRAGVYPVCMDCEKPQEDFSLGCSTNSLSLFKYYCSPSKTEFSALLFTEMAQSIAQAFSRDQAATKVPDSLPHLS